jgi:hypothetical protein
MGMRLWTDQTFLGGVTISRRKGAGRRWWDRSPSDIESNWGKHYCCCCWFGQKWPSKRIKNDSIIFEHPQDCSSSDSEIGFLLSRFFLLHDNAPAHKAASVCQFLTQKMLQPFITPLLSIFTCIFARLFYVPLVESTLRMLLRSKKP